MKIALLIYLVPGGLDAIGRVIRADGIVDIAKDGLAKVIGRLVAVVEASRLGEEKLSRSEGLLLKVSHMSYERYSMCRF